MNITRRSFIASAALLPVACGMPLSYENGTPVAAPKPLPAIRPPQVGQEWTYIKRNTFNGKTLGSVTERVTSVGSVITIESTSDNGSRMPSEIQGPWGMVSTDPNWGKILNFSPAIPLWPQELSAKWSKEIQSKYSIAGYPDSKLNWQEYMTVQGWEKISVPAGEFIALRYQSLISYESEDPNKVDCVHKETAWFAPQIGRWVAREISGSFRIQGQVNVSNMEDSFQWQLTAYK
jgi:hypothetical protein